MKEAVNERVREIIAEKNFSSVYLSSISDVHQTTIARQISGKCSVSIELVYAILHECPDISSDWLLMGKGEKYVSDNRPKITGNESDAELTDNVNELLKERVLLLKLALDAHVETIETQKRHIKSLESQIEKMETYYKALLHGSHDDYAEERQKKEIV